MKKNKDKPKEISEENKKNFLNQIAQMTPLELNKFINEYGKKPKVMNLLVIYK